MQGGNARELWLEISPRSFNVRVRDGLALTQLMVFLPWDRALVAYPPPPLATTVSSSASVARGVHPSAREVGAAAVSMDIYEEMLCFDAAGVALPLSLHKGAVVLSVCVPNGRGALAGYEALSTEDIIDLGEVPTSLPHPDPQP